MLFCRLMQRQIAYRLTDDGQLAERMAGPMTRLLEQALDQVQQFPQFEQDAIATLILDELADERLERELRTLEGATEARGCESA